MQFTEYVTQYRISVADSFYLSYLPDTFPTSRLEHEYSIIVESTWKLRHTHQTATAHSHSPKTIVNIQTRDVTRYQPFNARCCWLGNTTAIQPTKKSCSDNPEKFTFARLFGEQLYLHDFYCKNKTNSLHCKTDKPTKICAPKWERSLKVYRQTVQHGVWPSMRGIPQSIITGTAQNNKTQQKPQQYATYSSNLIKHRISTTDYSLKLS